MGNQRQYLKSGGFSTYLYEDHPDYSAVAINGIRGKVLHYIADGPRNHIGLPQYANTSDMYFRVGPDGKVAQGKVYVNRKHCIDFDWSHNHVNTKGDGRSFSKGIVHVQIYSVNEKGQTIRLSQNARYMNDSEIAKYGEIIHHFNPNVKFRP